MKYLIILILLGGGIYYVYYRIKKKINNTLRDVFGQMPNMDNQGGGANSGNYSNISGDKKEIVYKHGDTVILKGDAKDNPKENDGHHSQDKQI